jgi:hypothetical protein
MGKFFHDFSAPGQGLVQAILLTEKGRTAAIIIFLGILVALIFLLLPFLWGSRILYEDDVTYYYIPAFKFYHDALRSGDNFSLNPFVFSGFPLSLSQVGGFYDPINFFLFRILSFPAAYHARIFLDYWLAAIFTFLFTRALGLGPLASLVAAFAYLTSQNITPGMNILRANSFFLAPGLFYVIQSLSHEVSFSWRRAVPFIALGATIFGISFLGGYTQLNLYALVGAGLYVLFLSQRNRGSLPVSFLFSLISVFAIGILIFLPQLIKIFEFIPFTDRAGGLSWEFAKQGGTDFLFFLQSFLPYSRVLGTRQSLHIGFLEFFFAGAALAALIKKPRKSHIVFFASLALFSLMSSFSYPFFWLMHYLPPFRYFRFPPHWLFVASFALSVLAGLGYHDLREGEGGSALKKKIKNFLRHPVGRYIVILLLSLNFLIPAGYEFWDRSVEFKKISAAPWVIREIHTREKDLTSFRTFNFYPSDAQESALSRPWEEFFPQNSQAPTSVLIDSNSESFSSPSVSFSGEYQRRQHQEFENRLIDFKREYIHTHMTPSLWGIASVRGFDNFVPSRYKEILLFLDKGGLVRFAEPKSAGHLEDITLYIPQQTYRILGMMNVKYLWSVFKLYPGEKKDRVALLGETLFQKEPYVIPLYLYENKDFIPRIWNPREIRFLLEGENAFSEIFEKEHDFRTVGFIECGECGGPSLAENPVLLTDLVIKNNSLSFRAEGVESAWLVISNSFVPGWRAFIDGVETKLYRANYVYQGLRVPPGKHTIAIRYD